MQENQPGSRVLVFQKSGREQRYVLTDADYLDLARALEREGPPKLGVAWTLIQRFGMLYPLYSSFSTFVRAYAQPINPDWFPTGKRHLQAIEQMKGDLKAIAFENQQAQLRKQWAAVPLSQIGSDTRHVIDSIFSGQAPSPIPASSHYAAPITRKDVETATAARAAFAQRRNYQVLDYGNILTSNWFYGEAQMRGVKVMAMYVASTALALLAIGLTSGAAIGALYFIKRITS